MPITTRYRTPDADGFRHGNTPLLAVQSAIIVDAQLPGTPERGRIEAGLFADFIVIEIT